MKKSPSDLIIEQDGAEEGLSAHSVKHTERCEHGFTVISSDSDHFSYRTVVCGSIAALGQDGRDRLCALLTETMRHYISISCSSDAPRILAVGLGDPLVTPDSLGACCAEKIIADGKADIIAMARQLVCDPDTPMKGRTGHPELIRHCLRCGWCQSTRFIYSTARCSINPEIGHEYEMHEAPIRSVRKKVLIAGGGMAGMQAAITAADCGHQVILCEKTDHLGGHIRCEEKVPFKKHLKEYIERQVKRLYAAGVEVHLGETLTPAQAEALGYNLMPFFQLFGQ